MEKDYTYSKLLSLSGFKKVENTGEKFNKEGVLWRLEENLGSGYYWIYSVKDKFNIKIHNFYFHEDTLIESTFPRCINVTYYDSVSGEEFTPYRILKGKSLKTFYSEEKLYRAMIHKKIPIKSVCIEFIPTYFEKFLKENYEINYENISCFFKDQYETLRFPEMIYILNQVKHYRGEGLGAKLFYEGKVCEILSLIFDFDKKEKNVAEKLNPKDIENIKIVSGFIDDHSSFNLSLEQLSDISCMSQSKLKKCFKIYNKCSITEYIQNRRISNAINLFVSSSMSVKQVANTVGYMSCSRFSQLFKKYTGYLPKEYLRTLNK